MKDFFLLLNSNMSQSPTTHGINENLLCKREPKRNYDDIGVEVKARKQDLKLRGTQRPIKPKC